MRFVSVRDLREKSAEILKTLARLKEMVITSNGKPIAIISATSEDTFEGALLAIRAARAMMAVESLQLSSVAAKKDRMSLKDINTEIRLERKVRSK